LAKGSTATDRGLARARRRPGRALGRSALLPPQPLVAQPLLEGRVADVQPGQQLGAAARGLDRDLVRIERDRVLGDDQGRRGRAQLPAQPDQRLAQRGPRLRLAALGPQQGHERLAAARPSRRERQIGEQAPRLPGRDRELPAVGPRRPEPAE
jgi:hypothetical protein